MPLHTHATIRIKGRPGVADTFSSLQLTESITDHHRFRLTLPARSFGAGHGAAGWRELVGRRLTIEIAPPSAPTGGSDYAPKVFTGLITGLELGKTFGPNGAVVLTGGSPTLLADDDPHSQSFSGQPLQRIVSGQLGAYPANLLRSHIDPQTTGSLDYVVQYRENTWAFLQRLARTYGEWCYYDGRQLVFGRRRPQTTVLTHDVGLDDFTLQMGIAPANMEWTGYSYSADESARAAGPKPSGLGPYAQAAADAGGLLFPRTGTVAVDRPLNGSASGPARQAAARHQAASLAGLVTMGGTSHHPGLGVGNHVSVREATASSEAYGDYMLTQVHHHCSSDGQYQNTFRGMPVEAAAPPHHLGDYPTAEAQSAVVVDNNDPEDLGRVQVQLRWQQSGRTPWLRMAAPAGGAGKGFYMIPEKGEEVLVDFEGGNPERPYVLGTAWNGGSPSGLGTPKNDIKAIRTRSGHTITLNDARGSESITVKDKNGNVIHLDTKNKSITINAPEDMTLNAKNMEMNIQENLKVNVGKSKTERITEDHTLEAKNSTTKILKKRMVRSGEKTEQQAGELIFHTSNGDMTLDGTGKVTIQSKDRIDFGE